MNNKEHLLIAGIGLLVLTALVLQRPSFPDTVTVATDTNNTITVSGEAERSVAPDTARITFSLTRKNAVLSTATDSVNTRVSEMIEGLKEFGIKEKDIKTTNYNVRPEYDYQRNSGERSFSGYRVTQNMELKIRDLDRVSDVVSAIPQFEVDNVSGLQFYIDDDDEIRAELREEAITDAKRKARVLAKDLGVDLDVIVGFNEGGGGYYPKQNFNVRALSASFAEDESIEAAIPAGENQMSANVSITYQISK